MPTATFEGRVIHQPGPWGSAHPLRNVGKVTIWLMSSTQPMLFGNTTTNQNGWFKVTANLPAIPALDLYVQVDDPCRAETHMHHVTRPPRPNSSVLLPDFVGEIEVPWEPDDAQMANVNIFNVKETQRLARILCDLLKSPYYPIHITLFRESVDGTGQDYTPAQKLLIPLKAPRNDFLSRLVGDIRDEVVSAKSETVNDLAVEILYRLSLVDIKVLEEGRLLNRLLAAIQRAVGTNSYSESLMEDAVHDMAAACVVLFLAGLMHKDKVQPTIMFRPWSYKCSGNLSHNFSKILIDVNKG